MILYYSSVCGGVKVGEGYDYFTVVECSRGTSTTECPQSIVRIIEIHDYVLFPI